MQQRRPVEAVVAAAAAVVLAVVALVARSCAPGSVAAGSAGSAAGSAGSQLYATSGGVVWSFAPGRVVGQVSRSTDGGRNWRVVLPGPGPHPNLALSASYFLGPDLGWAVHQYLRDAASPHGARQLTTVLGTSDGGRHWWRSAPLVKTRDFLSYQPDFTDAQHGWLFGMQWTIEGDMVDQADEQLWRTSDGGHTWTRVRTRLPLQGTVDSDDEICPDEGSFHIAFANQQDGWLTASTCPAVGIAPQVWRTTDSGVTWKPARLPAPSGGWPSANDTYDGVTVGTPWMVGSELLVAVADQTGLTIEASADGGRSWHLASRVPAGALRYISTGWFEPVDAGHWVISAPGELIETSDAGRIWHVIRTTSGPKGGPFWFTSIGHGYARGSGGVTLATSNSGRTWSTAAAPAPARPAPGPVVTAVQEISPDVAIASGPRILRVSRDAGRTWTPLLAIPSDQGLGPAQFLDVSTGFAIDHPGRRLWRTTDGGSSWTPLQVPHKLQLDHVQFWTPENGAAIIRGRGVDVTTNGGRDWRPSKLPNGYLYNLFMQLDGSRRLRLDAYPRNQYACFASGTGWLVTFPPHNPERQDVLVSTDGGVHWRQVLAPAILPTTSKAQLTAWLGGCRGSQAWVEVMRNTYKPPQRPTYDLLHTTDDGRTWQDVLHIQDGTDLPQLRVPLSAAAQASSPQPAALTLIPEPLALPTTSAAWLTFVTGNGSIAFAVSPDDGQHWQWHWFRAPRHLPRTAPASRSDLPVGLPWLATTATDSGHAWVLLGSTNGSGDSFLYATSDGGATWNRITTFR
jgi:photosystem II stability/assembly factor-like uncharacterized protein